MLRIAPDRVCVIDFNGAAAFDAAGFAARPYPGLLPVPDTVIKIGGPLVLEPWHRHVCLHAELFVITGLDTGSDRGATLHYGLGLGAWGDGLLANLKRPTPRDTAMGTDFGYYWDGSRILGDRLWGPEELPWRQQTLGLYVPGKAPMAYPLKDLIWDGSRLVREVSEGGVRFRPGEVICLGPVAGPVRIEPNDRFAAGDCIRVAGAALGELTVPIHDRRQQRWFQGRR